MTRAYVFSDIHLSTRGQHGVFQEHKLLAQTLNRLAACTEPTELVLAGDVFDYLELPGYSGWSAANAVRSMEKLLNNNQTVTEALCNLASNTQMTVTLLAGNHDPEVALEPVREAFRKRLSLDTARFHWDQELPRTTVRQGIPWVERELARGRVLVVHGDLWDPFNRIDRRCLLAENAASALQLPPGSQVVYELLPRLCARYPWVYFLHPLSLSIWILLCIDPEFVQEIFGRHQTLIGELVMARLRPIILGAPVLSASDQVPPTGEQPAGRGGETDSGQVLASLLADGILATPDALPGDELSEERTSLERELELFFGQALGTNPTPLRLDGDTLSGWHHLSRLLRALLHLRGRSTFAQPAVQPRWLSSLGDRDLAGDDFAYSLDHGMGLVAGHSHGPRFRRLNGRTYVNSGAWIPLGYLIGDSVTEFLSAIQHPEHNQRPRGPASEHSAWAAETPRTYVEVAPDGQLTLRRITDDGTDLIVAR